MDRKSLMGAADGALVGFVGTLAYWKLSQPAPWQIITANELWFSPLPLALALGFAVAGALAGWSAARKVPGEGLFPIAVRWLLIATSVGTVAWIGFRAAQGRGPSAEVAWANGVRARLAGCSEPAAAVHSINEEFLRATLVGECAKLAGDVAGAEKTGREKHQGGAEFPAVSKAEQSFLSGLKASEAVRILHPEAPVSVSEAIAHGKEVAKTAQREGVKIPDLASGKKQGAGANSDPHSPVAPNSPADPRANLDGGKDSSVAANDGGATTASGVDGGAMQTIAGGEGSHGGTDQADSGEGKPVVENGGGGDSHSSGGKGGKGGPTPFEQLAAAATCMYFGAPPPLCTAAIGLINSILGGLFGSDPEVRNEEITKLMGAVGEFAGVNGDFAGFDEASFAARFAEFDFRDPEEGAQAFVKLLEQLKASGAIKSEGVQRALDAARGLQKRFDQVSSCAKTLHDTARKSAGDGSGVDLKLVFAKTSDLLATCVPADIKAKGEEAASRYFQNLPLLKGNDLVGCVFAIAVTDAGVKPERLSEGHFPSPESCEATRALLRKLGLAK